MLHPSTQKLIEKLSELTGQHKIAWSSGENGSVVYDTEGYRVALTPEPHEVILLDPLGKELERAGAEELGAATTSAGASFTALAASMFKEAVRVARGTETAIGRVLAGLEKVAQDEPGAALASIEEEPFEAEEPVTATDETEIAVAPSPAPGAAEEAPAAEGPSFSVAEASDAHIPADEAPAAKVSHEPGEGPEAQPFSAMTAMTASATAAPDVEDTLGIAGPEVEAAPETGASAAAASDDSADAPMVSLSDFLSEPAPKPTLRPKQETPPPMAGDSVKDSDDGPGVAVDAVAAAMAAVAGSAPDKDAGSEASAENGQPSGEFEEGEVQKTARFNPWS